ncbi:MAG TPA: PilZ domain-containing protein [Terriglobales bacterium]|nr:PilZ domain-containing protein [Terriglobales bacterium]
MTVTSAAIDTTKPASRVVLVNLTVTESEIFKECFKSFHIQTQALAGQPAERLAKEKFEGCVLRLDDRAEEILKAARGSKSNRGIVIYGISPDILTAMRFSKYGINAVLNEPLERANVLRAVRATYLLALHEFRRYVRIPVAIQVDLRCDGRTVSALSQEVSSGGMSLECANLLPGKTQVDATFQLPDIGFVTLKSEICWRREASSSLGIRFITTDVNRQEVRNWIDHFMDNVR